MTTHRGSCHCGKVQLTFETAIAPADLPVRECTCTFCRRHAPRYTSDPAGRVTLTFRADDVSRYLFGLRTADFILCRHCGVFVAAVSDGFAIVNLNALDERAAFTQPPASRNFDGESETQRLARRAANWTPAVVICD